MAFDPSVTPFLLTTPATPDLGVPNSSNLVATSTYGLTTRNSGGGGTFEIRTVGNLLNLVNMTTNGIMVMTDANDSMTTRVIAGNSSINVANPDGIAGNPTLSVVNDTSTQRLTPMYNSQSSSITGLLPRSTWNLIPGENISITMSDNAGANRTDIQIAATGGGGGGSGTVTSVALSSTDSLLTITGSPITTAGTFGISINTLPVTKLAPSSTNGYSLQTIGGVVQWAAGGGGGSGLTSVGLTSTGSTATITGSPLTANGAMNIEIPNWSSVAASTNVQMQGHSVLFVDSLGFASDGSGDLLSLSATGEELNMTDSVNIGRIFDSFFNPIGGTGTSGQVLSLVSSADPTSGATQVLQWVTSGSGSGISSIDLTSTDTGLGITQSTTTGAYTASISNSWWKVTAADNVALGANNLTTTGNVTANTLTLPTRQLAVNETQLTVSGDGGAQYGLIYDSFYNVIGGTGTVGQVLSLTANATAGAVQTLAWVNAGSGGATIPGAANSMTAATTLVVGTTNIAPAGSDAGPNNYVFNDVGITASVTDTYQDNAIFGQDAGSALITGGQNTLIGIGAGHGIEIGGGNTAVGFQAGPGANNCNGCTFIGNEAQALAAGLTNCIVIGDQAQVSISNAAVIGNPGGPMALGIGTTEPAANLAGGNPVAQLHLSQISTPGVPSAIILDTMSEPAGSVSPSYPGDGMYITNIEGVLSVASTPGTPLGGIPLFDRTQLSSGAYPGGSVLYVGDQNFFEFASISNLSPVPTTGLYTLVIDAGNNYQGTMVPHTSAATSFLAMSFPVTGSNDVPANPVQNVSYIAYPDPDEPGTQTFFSLPTTLAIGSSFRVIGSNPYGWIVSTDLTAGISQRILFNDSMVLGTPSAIAAIQTDPSAPFPTSNYLNSVVELVYTVEEGDGTQVWTVVNAVGELDLFQS